MPELCGKGREGIPRAKCEVKYGLTRLEFPFLHFKLKRADGLLFIYFFFARGGNRGASCNSTL